MSAVVGLLALLTHTTDSIASPAEITREAVLPARGPAGRPLPLFSHWNTGKTLRAGWEPNAQLFLIQQGHHVLPWFEQPDDGRDAIESDLAQFAQYYDRALIRSRDLRLPISLVGSQWERFLSEPPYLDLPYAQNPNLVDRWGRAAPRVTPFGPVDAWREVGRRITSSRQMRRLQRLYPDPPLVVFVSNNEHPKLRPADAEQSRAYVARYGTGQSEAFKRRVFAQGWAERYRALQAGMRDGLVEEQWKRAALFVGYDAFPSSEVGRYSRWRDGTMYTLEGGESPERAWDGASVSYYVNNWNDKTDYTTRSPQVEAMNLVYPKERIEVASPRFWFELSVWDGYAPGEGNDKRRYYRSLGQTYSPARYGGFVQFGLWLLRPRVLREFRGFEQPWADSRDYFMAALTTVDAVYASPVLSEWWRHGELVANPRHSHPYQEELAEPYLSAARWFLLDTDPGPAVVGSTVLRRQVPAEIPVFALALRRGLAPERSWLVYAYAPLLERTSVAIVIPRYRAIHVDVPMAGAFYEVTEKTGAIQRIR